MSLNIKQHRYVSYTTYNLFKKIKRQTIFIIRHTIFSKIKQHIIVLYNIYLFLYDIFIILTFDYMLFNF